jgi:hypothetical protein
LVATFSIDSAIRALRLALPPAARQSTHSLFNSAVGFFRKAPAASIAQREAAPQRLQRRPTIAPHRTVAPEIASAILSSRWLAK